MAHFSTTIETKASPEDAFHFVADFSNTATWDPTVSRARRLTKGAIRKGSRFEVFLLVAGREIRFEYAITRYQRDRCVVLESSTDLLRSLDTIEFEPLPTGTRIHYDADLRPRGAAYLFDLPIHVAFQVSGAASARGLERALSKLD